MGKEIQIHLNSSEVNKKLQKLKEVENGAPKAVMRAMNRTVTGMRTDAGREVSARYTVKQADVKDKLDLDKASITDLSIAMRSKGRPMRLVKFSHEPNKNPGVKGSPTVFAQVKKSGSGGFTGGFMATMRSTNGITGIFMRTGKLTRRGKNAGKGREGIKQLYGPGSVQMLDNKETREVIQKKAVERFNKELDHQIDYLLK